MVIDELGRGTSTCDGIALSRAIALHLAEAVGCFTYFATHFHELAHVASPAIGNLHVAAEIDAATGALALLYQVRGGACDRSFGVHVAGTVGFPRAVLKRAEFRADVLEGRLALARALDTAPGSDPSRVPELAKYFI